MRDYVEVNHRTSVFFKPPVPVGNYDVDTDCYSWDWGGLHLVQTHRFAGDVGHGAVSGLPWLQAGPCDLRGRRPAGGAFPALWLGRVFCREVGSGQEDL